MPRDIEHAAGQKLERRGLIVIYLSRIQTASNLNWETYMILFLVESWQPFQKVLCRHISQIDLGKTRHNSIRSPARRAKAVLFKNTFQHRPVLAEELFSSQRILPNLNSCRTDDIHGKKRQPLF